MDVGALIGALGIEARKRGGIWRACCPLPGHDEAEPSWSIVDRPGRDGHGDHYCFGCKRGGGPVSLVADRLEVSFPAAHDWMRARGLEDGSVAAPPTEVTILSRSRKAGKIQDPEGVRFGPVASWPKPARDYLKARNISDEQVERWRIGYAVDGWLRGRIYFPFEDSGGSLRSYSARSFDGSEKRYLTPREEEHPDPGAIFGERWWPVPELRDTVFLAEGAIKLLACERVGAPAIAGPGGSVLTPTQVSKLKTFARIVHVSDGDNAGAEFAGEVRGSLGRWVTFVEIPMQRGVDCDRLPADSLREKLELWL